MLPLLLRLLILEQLPEWDSRPAATTWALIFGTPILHYCPEDRIQRSGTRRVSQTTSTIPIPKRIHWEFSGKLAAKLLSRAVMLAATPSANFKRLTETL